MGKFITDEVFGSLASRLGHIDVERTYGQALDWAADEGVEILRQEIRGEGGDAEIASAVKVIRRRGAQGLERTVGVPGNHEAAEKAAHFEFGSPDHKVSPHGLFRFVQGDMAHIATEDASTSFSRQIVGG